MAQVAPSVGQVDISGTVLVFDGIAMMRVLLCSRFLIALIAKRHGKRMQALHRQAENQQQYGDFFQQFWHGRYCSRPKFGMATISADRRPGIKFTLRRKRDNRGSKW